MTPDVVVDVGNTRIKRGVRGPDGTLKLDYIDSEWFNVEGLPRSLGRAKLVVAGSHPERRAQFARWASGLHDVVEITSHEQLPIDVDVDHPEKVGIDRLLGAVAANRLRTPGRAAMTVDVGTAATVNLVDANGTFTGGLILPGVRLMLLSLHENTSKLPLVESGERRFADRTFPGRSTEDAIRAGVSYAIAGAVRLALEHAKVGEQYPELFLTGGGSPAIADLLANHLPRQVPTLVLDGLVIAAETLP